MRSCASCATCARAASTSPRRLASYRSPSILCSGLDLYFLANLINHQLPISNDQPSPNYQRPIEMSDWRLGIEEWLVVGCWILEVEGGGDHCRRRSQRMVRVCAYVTPGCGASGVRCSTDWPLTT